MQRAQSDVRPSRYINYRLISEIKRGLAVNDEGASEPGSGDTRCNVCLTMKATRMATPCGHNVVCRPCAVSMTDDEIFHQSTFLLLSRELQRFSFLKDVIDDTSKRIMYATSIRAQHSSPYDWCAATSRHIVQRHAVDT
ncbi:hypothetical protein J6590_026850 [Homalodisca vitripennis]|nr:hypothetical protein J6590_026850 [Homalodisca vitripennis]